MNENLDRTATLQRDAAKVMGVRIGNSERLLRNCLEWLTLRGTVEINQCNEGFSVSCSREGSSSGTSMVWSSLVLAMAEAVCNEVDPHETQDQINP